MAKHIPIKSAKEIAEKYGYDQVMIYARKTGEDGIEHVTTYGINKEHCDAIAKGADYLKYNIFGWEK